MRWVVGNWLHIDSQADCSPKVTSSKELKKRGTLGSWGQARVTWRSCRDTLGILTAGRAMWSNSKVLVPTLRAPGSKGWGSLSRSTVPECGEQMLSELHRWGDRSGRGGERFTQWWWSLVTWRKSGLRRKRGILGKFQISAALTRSV